MHEKLLLGFLGFLETSEYTLGSIQSHDGSPFSVALANTTLEGEHSCGLSLSQNCPQYC